MCVSVGRSRFGIWITPHPLTKKTKQTPTHIRPKKTVFVPALCLLMLILDSFPWQSSLRRVHHGNDIAYCRAISGEKQPCITLLEFCLAAHPHTCPSSPISIAWEYCWLVVPEICIQSLTKHIECLKKKKKKADACAVWVHEFRPQSTDSTSLSSACSIINSSNGSSSNNRSVIADRVWLHCPRCPLHGKERIIAGCRRGN